MDTLTMAQIERITDRTYDQSLHGKISSFQRSLGNKIASNMLTRCDFRRVYVVADYGY